MYKLTVLEISKRLVKIINEWERTRFAYTGINFVLLVANARMYVHLHIEVSKVYFEKKNVIYNNYFIAQNEEVEAAYCLPRFTKHLHLVEQMCDGNCKSQQFLMELHSFVAQGILVKMLNAFAPGKK